MTKAEDNKCYQPDQFKMKTEFWKVSTISSRVEIVGFKLKIAVRMLTMLDKGKKKRTLCLEQHSHYSATTMEMSQTKILDLICRKTNKNDKQLILLACRIPNQAWVRGVLLILFNRKQKTYKVKIMDTHKWEKKTMIGMNRRRGEMLELYQVLSMLSLDLPNTAMTTSTWKRCSESNMQQQTVTSYRKVRRN